MFSASAQAGGLVGVRTRLLYSQLGLRSSRCLILRQAPLDSNSRPKKPKCGRRRRNPFAAICAAFFRALRFESASLASRCGPATGREREIPLVVWAKPGRLIFGLAGGSRGEGESRLSEYDHPNLRAQSTDIAKHCQVGFAKKVQNIRVSVSNASRCSGVVAGQP